MFQYFDIRVTVLIDNRLYVRSFDITRRIGETKGANNNNQSNCNQASTVTFSVTQLINVLIVCHRMANTMFEN